MRSTAWEEAGDEGEVLLKGEEVFWSVGVSGAWGCTSFTPSV